MIKNEKQYKITFKKLLTVLEQINQLQGDGTPLTAKEKLLLVSSRTMEEQLKTEIAAYDLIKTDISPILIERSIDHLPNLLVEFKIRSGMTQKEFSEKIGMKEQQLQRYEAENYSSISFKNLLRILDAIGLEVTVKGNMSGNRRSQISVND